MILGGGELVETADSMSTNRNALQLEERQGWIMPSLTFPCATSSFLILFFSSYISYSGCFTADLFIVLALQNLSGDKL